MLFDVTQANRHVWFVVFTRANKRTKQKNEKHWFDYVLTRGTWKLLFFFSSRKLKWKENEKIVAHICDKIESKHSQISKEREEEKEREREWAKDRVSEKVVFFSCARIFLESQMMPVLQVVFLSRFLLFSYVFLHQNI